MFRICLLVCVSLISSITAKPWDKLRGEAFQDTVLSIDDEGKMSMKVEVEPPEDMDKIQYEIDPSMKIWKSMTGGGQYKQLQKAEEDLDDLYHPSVEDLQGQIINLDAIPAAHFQAEPLKEDADMKDSQVASKEEDWNEIANKARKELHRYLAPLAAESSDGFQGADYGPEEDKDDLYHRDDQSWSVEMEPLEDDVRSEIEVRIHNEPEEDMDDLYHKDFLLPVTYEDYARAAAPMYLPSQKEYSKPEEDLDDLYHP